MIKTTLLTASLVCLTVAATAQTTSKRASTTNATSTTTVKEEVKIDQEYALPTEKLVKAFKTSIIPKDFPTYDHKIDHDANKKNGLTYLSTHKELLTEDAIAWLKERGL